MDEVIISDINEFINKGDTDYFILLINEQLSNGIPSIDLINAVRNAMQRQIQKFLNDEIPDTEFFSSLTTFKKAYDLLDILTQDNNPVGNIILLDAGEMFISAMDHLSTILESFGYHVQTVRGKLNKNEQIGLIGLRFDSILTLKSNRSGSDNTIRHQLLKTHPELARRTMDVFVESPSYHIGANNFSFPHNLGIIISQVARYTREASIQNGIHDWRYETISWGHSKYLNKPLSEVEDELIKNEKLSTNQIRAEIPYACLNGCLHYIREDFGNCINGTDGEIIHALENIKLTAQTREKSKAYSNNNEDIDPREEFKSALKDANILKS
jgi:hypothetical protein